MYPEPTHIVIQLSTEKDIDDVHDLGRWAIENEVEGLSEAFKTIEEVAGGVLPPVRRLVTAYSVAELRALELAAEDGEWPPMASLTQYWRINLDVLDPSSRESRLKEIAAFLREISGIELAYVEPPVVVPDTSPDEERTENAQADRSTGPGRPKPRRFRRTKVSHLSPAPWGINAEWAWDKDGGSGAWRREEGRQGKVRLIDVEAAWQLDHEALLQLKVPLPLSGWMDQIKDHISHGTAVLGIVGGALPPEHQEHLKMRGICPEARIFVSSYSGTHVTNVLLGARKVLRCGDVVLLEVTAMEDEHGGQFAQRPIERDIAVRHAMRLLADAGIVVIEAAGNADVNLDELSTDNDLADLNDPDPGADSGAILVGGCHAVSDENGPQRWSELMEGSNYGARVNCYAWAEKVRASGCKPPTYNHGCDPSHGYRDFGGTSAASAIIAGAAVLAQSLYRTVSGRLLTPRELRALFSDPNNGTPTLTDDRIGVMPDLNKVADAASYLP